MTDDATTTDETTHDVTEGPSDGTAVTEETAPAGAPPKRNAGLALLAFLAPVVVAVVAVVLLAGRGGDGGDAGPAVPEGQTYTYTIPAGTAAAEANGADVDDVLPETLSLSVGDSIVVVNEDDVTHSFGPVTVRAGETGSVQFVNAGIYFGLCTVGTHDSVTIQVT
jgi:hypothetical protein